MGAFLVGLSRGRSVGSSSACYLISWSSLQLKRNREEGREEAEGNLVLFQHISQYKQACSRQSGLDM